MKFLERQAYDCMATHHYHSALCSGHHADPLLPFILFQKNTPKTVQYLGKALPPASFALLLVYCLRNVQLFSGNHGLPEFLSLGLTILIHCWKRNMLLSIFSGTVLYMLFQQGILALPF